MKMLYHCKAILLCVSFAFLFFGKIGISFAAGPTIITSDIASSTVWNKENGPYVIQNTITVNAPLVINHGTVVKFNNNSATLVIKSDFSATGTSEEKIVFTSVCDDSYGGDTRSYSLRCNSGPTNSEWGGISLYNTMARATIAYALIFRASRGISYHNIIQSLPYRNVSIRHTEIRQCSTAIFLRNTMPILEL